MSRRAGKGMTLTNFIVPTPLCCPARSLLLTGRYGHNTNITSNRAPYGAWQLRSAAP